MKKGKVARVAGFVGALGVSAVLVTTAVQGTGAYFTASQGGNLHATSGSLQISTTGTYLNFAGLNPGVDQSLPISYTVKSSSTTNADIWIVFDHTSAAYGAFTGATDTTYTTGTTSVTDGGLGGYGHFKVVSNQGYGFESYNLQLPKGSDYNTAFNQSNAQGVCNVTANGNGGSTAKAVGTDNATQAAPECGVPAYIQIGADIAPGASGNASITFGLTGKAVTQGVVWANVPFQIVATQPGVRPDAANF